MKIELDKKEKSMSLNFSLPLPLSTSFIRLLGVLLFLVICVLLFTFFVGRGSFILMGSMNPTLYENDKVFVERTTILFSNPKRGDVVCFPDPLENVSNSPLAKFERVTGLHCRDKIVVKRVIGLPGEKIVIKPDKNGRSTVYINDKKLEEKYILTNPKDIFSQFAYGPYIIPKNSYYVLGDNRDNSIDSRVYDFVSRDKFIGKVLFVFYPFKRAKWL